MAASKILEDAKHHSMTQKTLRRAAEDMEVVKNPPGGGRNCTWDLPQAVKDLLDPPEEKKPPEKQIEQIKPGAEEKLIEQSITEGMPEPAESIDDGFDEALAELLEQADREKGNGDGSS